MPLKARFPRCSMHDVRQIRNGICHPPARWNACGGVRRVLSQIRPPRGHRNDRQGDVRCPSRRHIADRHLGRDRAGRVGPLPVGGRAVPSLLESVRSACRGGRFRIGRSRVSNHPRMHAEVGRQPGHPTSGPRRQLTRPDGPGRGAIVEATIGAERAAGRLWTYRERRS